MERVTISGLSVAYQRVGRGPALVLLHGFSLDSRSCRPQLEALSDQFTVITWDAPGAGQSDDPPDSFTLTDWANALAGVLDAAGVQHANIIGLSWGGLLAQAFYRAHPWRVLSLVLADTYAGWSGSLPPPMPEQRLAAALDDSTLPADEFVRRYLPGMFSDAVANDVRRELADIMAEMHPAGFRTMATVLARADTRAWLPAIRVPTLLIWGSADARSPLTVAQAMRDAIPAARLAVIRGAGHLSNLERSTEFNALVREFCLTRPVR